MARPQPLIPGQYFHVYNRGIDGTSIFRESRNYPYFLALYIKYIFPIATTCAYCLMGNHFHLLIQVREPAQGQSFEDCQSYASAQFQAFFSTYTKSFNKAFGRSGSLFEKPFKRKIVKTDAYFTRLVTYIHQNPQSHGFVDNFSDWKVASYQAILSQGETKVERALVLDWFGGKAGVAEAHKIDVDTSDFEHLLFD